MKHNRLLSLLLAAVLLLGLLSGCGKAPDSQGAAQASAPSPAASPNAALSAQSSDPIAPRYAYVPELFALPSAISGVSCADCADALAFFGATVEGETIRYFRTITDENGNESELEITRPTYFAAVFTLDLGTKEITELKDFTLPGAPEGWDDVDYSIENINVLPDRTAWVGVCGSVIRYNLPEDFDPERNHKSSYAEYGERQSYLLHISEQGAELGRIPLGDLMGFRAVTDDKGRVYVAGEKKLSVYDAQGELSFTLENPDNDPLCRFRRDRVAVAAFGFDPVTLGNAPELRPIDAELQAYGQAIPLTDYCSEIMPGDDGYDFYYRRGTGIFAYLQSSEERPCILNWLECGFVPANVTNVCMLPSGDIFAFNWEDRKDAVGTVYQAMLLRHEDVTGQPEKTVLKMAAYLGDTFVERAVVDFNRSSGTCCISYTDYASVGITPEAGLTLLNTQIMAGDVPDLFVTTHLPISQLAARGLLADLYPIIDSGKNGLTRDSFVQPVLKALETDGKLYQIPVSFAVSTAYGLERVVGGYDRWDFDAVQDAMSRLPQADATVFHKSYIKTTALDACLNVNLDSFVDRTTGTCSFDSDGFVSLLNFADSFPAEYDSKSDSDPYASEAQRIVNGAQLLSATSLITLSPYSVSSLWLGEPTVFVGFPSGGVNNGSCFMLNMNRNPMAISASCRDVDSAWAFISSFLTEEYQSDPLNYLSGIPMNRAVYESKLKTLTECRYLTDANGEPIPDENGAPIPDPWNTLKLGKSFPADFKVTNASGDLIAAVDPDDPTALDIFRVPDEMIEAVVNLIESTTTVMSEESSLKDIIKEECAILFAGQKTAKQTAEVIQSRASIYVAEQS